ncbi:hypothetical protein GJ744_007753 [Endocarpon pusillum]|uniref:Fungal N-terminal domain-containing protein n=1 Tax=Endocarpon pusillum TaxID=364733 RepID=A0A8H7E900_9EURO|nr:hypothetical protein GJ744_007753 [Endocarpon pusillum]
MADPFSMAASCFAVVGLTDVVIRAGKEIYHHLIAITDAPAEVESLRCCIHDNLLLVKDLKLYWQDLRASASLPPSATTPALNRALPLFRSALETLNRELTSLVALYECHDGITKTKGRFKWVLDEPRILKYLQRLESSKSTLVAALVLVGRRQDHLYQRSVESKIHHGFQNMTTKFMGHLQRLESGMQNFRKSVSARQTSLGVSNSHLHEQAAGMQKHPLSVNRNALREDNKNRYQTSQGNAQVIDTTCSKLQDLPGNLSPAYKSTIKNSRQIRFNGHSLEATLLPLLLLKAELRGAILMVMSQHSGQVSPRYLYWLESEFGNLVSSATQEVAATSESSTATSFDDWIYAQGGTSYLIAQHGHRYPPMSKKTPINEYESSHEKTKSTHVDTRKRLRSSRQSFSFMLPVGRIVIVMPRRNCGWPNASDSYSIHEVGFSFSPQSRICSTSIQGRFMKVKSLRPEPRLHAQLNAFNMVRNCGLHIELISCGTLKEIDAAIRNGRISPYDVNKDMGNVCLYIAAYFGRVDLFHYFNSQGIGPSDLGGEHGALFGLWNSWIILLKEEKYDFQQENECGRTPILDQLATKGCLSLEMVRLLLEFNVNVHATDCDGQNALQCAMWSLRREEQRGIMEQKLYLLIRAGVDANHCDELGETPSDHARKRTCWKEWCGALESNSLKVDEVLQADEEQRKAFWQQRVQESGSRVQAEQTSGDSSKDWTEEWIEMYANECAERDRRRVSKDPAGE